MQYVSFGPNVWFFSNILFPAALWKLLFIPQNMSSGLCKNLWWWDTQWSQVLYFCGLHGNSLWNGLLYFWEDVSTFVRETMESNGLTGFSYVCAVIPWAMLKVSDNRLPLDMLMKQGRCFFSFFKKNGGLYIWFYTKEPTSILFVFICLSIGIIIIWVSSLHLLSNTSRVKL